MQVENEQSNVIAFDFDRRVSEESKLDAIAKEIYSHLSDEMDDPLEDLLNEFEDLQAEDLAVEESKIVGCEERTELRVSYDMTALEMSNTILNQIKELNTDVKRLSYYLDELNIEKSLD